MKRELLILCMAAVLLSACSSAPRQGEAPAPRETASVTAAEYDISSQGNTLVHFGEDKVTAEGAGVRVSGKYADIIAAGTYVIDGSAEGGMITVKAGKNDTVVLILNGLSLTNPTGAAIYTENAGLTQIVLQDGTQNTVTSGAAADVLSGISADENAEGAAIWSKDDLLITGNGSLCVYGYINNGIQSADNFAAQGGNITVEALNNGIKGKDSVRISGGNMDIKAGNNGIKSDCADGDGFGTVTVTGGNITLRTNGDGVQAQTVMELSGGNFDVQTGGGADKKKSRDKSSKGFKADKEMAISGGVYTADCSDDAFHSGGTLKITGGTLIVRTGDDAVHGEDSLSVEDGSVEVTKCYEGLEADIISISGGNISVIASDDGINASGGPRGFGNFGNFGGFGGFGGRDKGGQPPDFTRGDMPDFSRGDMPEPPGDMPEFSREDMPEFSRGDMPEPPGDMPEFSRGDMPEPPGDMPEFSRGDMPEPPKNMPQQETSEDTEVMPEINISGGTIYVNAEGDGLDSNGNITVSGGDITVDGPSSNGNGAIDIGTEAGGTAVISGGTVLAVGSSGMAETFGSGSSQCSFMYNLPAAVPAGAEIVIKDSSGKTLVSHTAVRTVSSVVFGSPLLREGETYTLICGGTEYTITQEGVSCTAGKSGGFGNDRGFGRRDKSVKENASKSK